MSTILTVIIPFGGYTVGVDITDPTAITNVLASNPQYVVKVDATRNTSPSPPTPPVTSGPLTSNTATVPFNPPTNKTFYLELTGTGSLTGAILYRCADGSYAPAAVGTDGSAPVVMDKVAYNGGVQNGVRIALRVDQSTTDVVFKPGVVTGAVAYAFVS